MRTSPSPARFPRSRAPRWTTSPSALSESIFRTEGARRISAGASPRRVGPPGNGHGSNARRTSFATTQALARYWATDYDWRKVEAKLNALPNFITEINGLDIHFIHVRSKHEKALPLIVTHGWPGSIIEQD